MHRYNQAKLVPLTTEWDGGASEDPFDDAPSRSGRIETRLIGPDASQRDGNAADSAGLMNCVYDNGVR